LLSKNIFNFVKSNFSNLITKETNPSKERDRLFFITVSSSFFSKSVTLLVSIVTLPLSLQYLGTTDFAILNTIVSTFNILIYFDFGIGIGLQNMLPGYIVQQKQDKIVELVSSVFLFLLISSFILIIVSLLLLNFNDLRSLFNLNYKIDSNRFNQTVFVSIILVALGMPISIVQRIQIAYQKTYINDWFFTLGSILSLIMLLLSIKNNLKLPFILFSLQGSLIIVFFLNFIYSVNYSKLLVLDIRKSNFKAFQIVSSFGLKYFIIILFSAGLFTIDNFILLKFRSPEDVTEYSIVYRFISLLNVPIIIYSNTFLPAYNDANARGDEKWIKIAIQRATKIILLLSLAEALFFIFFGEIIIVKWSSTQIVLNGAKLFIYTLLIFFLNINFYISAIALSTKYLNFTLKFFSLAVIISVILKFIVVKYFDVEYIYVILPTIIIMTSLYIFPLNFIIFKHDLKHK
jgi:O-antigen/teichoic acid export membrane protein